MFIVGLGNPGTEYAHNRHNVGFHFVDWIAQEKLGDAKWHTNTKNHFAYISTKLGSDRLVLIKPHSFMNRSGHPTHAALDFFQKGIAERLIVAHDDLDIMLGAWKLDLAKGPKMHNGIDSVEASLRTDQFWRARIGIDNRNPANRIDGETYVLHDFVKEERDVIVSEFPLLWERIATYK
jgi:peptidyl-tRNA hydrolase, PTH1 family